MAWLKTLKKPLVGLVSLLGALGIGLQNYMAVLDLLKVLLQGSIAVSKTSKVFLHLFAVALGSVCSSFVNLFINIGLLESFLQRLTQKEIPKLKAWQKFQYWFGSSIFILTGILFGLTAFAFGPLGPLAVLSITAGIFVAIIMMIQELETWLAGFDDTSSEKKSFSQLFHEWVKTLSLGKLIGHIITLGNVIALSLLFTLGLANFLIGLGLPLTTALVVGFCCAFTVGAFTEFYFYNWFLAPYCDKFSEKWQQFWQSKFSPLGLLMSTINGMVNAVLSYVGILMVAGLIATAGITLPMLPVMIVAASLSVFSGLASFILGLDFWEANSKKLFSLNKEIPTTTTLDKAPTSTGAIVYTQLIENTPLPDKLIVESTGSVFSVAGNPLQNKQAVEDKAANDGSSLNICCVM